MSMLRQHADTVMDFFSPSTVLEKANYSEPCAHFSCHLHLEYTHKRTLTPKAHCFICRTIGKLIFLAKIWAL